MSLNNRVERLEKHAERLKLKSQVILFDSHEEYERACARGEIKDHYICLIDDVPEHDDSKHITIRK